jgi:hypothetical protein
MATFNEYDDLEKLLKLEKEYFRIKEPTVVEEEKPVEEEDKNPGAVGLQKANGNASLLDFLDMVSLIITNTMDDLHVECMPDEKAYVIKDDPVEAINHPIVTFKVNSRRHKENSGYKPKLIETVQDSSNKTAFIYSERFLSHVQFNIMACEYRIAWTVMERIEDALLSYAETIRGNGIVEYYFNRQYEDRYYDTFRNTLTVLNLEYCIETEKLRVIFKENIKDIVQNDDHDHLDTN